MKINRRQLRKLIKETLMVEFRMENLRMSTLVQDIIDIYEKYNIAVGYDRSADFDLKDKKALAKMIRASEEQKGMQLNKLYTEFKNENMDVYDAAMYSDLETLHIAAQRGDFSALEVEKEFVKWLDAWVDHEHT